MKPVLWVWRIASCLGVLWLGYVFLSGAPAWLVLWNVANLAVCLGLLRSAHRDVDRPDGA